MRNLKKVSACVLSLVLFCLAFMVAQRPAIAQETLATLEGYVKDSSGSGLPGASILMVNLNTGYQYSTMSKAEGRYIVTGIVPGAYDITAKMPSFGDNVRNAVTFSIGARLTLDFHLSSSIQEEVSVTAPAPLVEITKSEISSVVTREQIDSLPLVDRSFYGLAALKPGVMDYQANATPWASEGFVLDGVSNTRNVADSARSNIPSDAIQEFRVLTNQFAAEYGNVSGLLQSALTRSGTNEFKGRVSAFLRDEVFDNKNYFATAKSKFSQWRFGGFFGGPIAKDKTHFFLSYEGLRNTSYNVVTSPLVETESVPYYQTNNQVLVKLNHQFNEKNTLSFRFSYDRPFQENAGIGGLNTKEAGYDYGVKSLDFQGNWTYFPSGNTMNEFRILYGYVKESNDPLTPSSATAYSIVRPSGTLGKYYYSPYWFDEKRLQIVDNFSFFLNKHNIKVGFDLNFIGSGGQYDYYYPGQYIFQTDLPFNANDPATYPYQLIYAESPVPQDLPVRNHGIFVEDSWKVLSRLTLNLGLRYNYYSLAALDIDNSTIKSFNPRLGFSWDLLGDGKMAIRGGFGTFSNNIFTVPATRIQRGNAAHFTYLRYPGYPDPDVPNPFVPPVDVSPLYTEYLAQENQIPPYTLQATIGFQRQLFQDVAFSADFVYARGYHLFYQSNLNPPIPGQYPLRPDPTKVNVFVYDDSGKSDYKGLQIVLNKRYAHNWAVEVAYTLSKSMTNCTDWFDSNWNNPELDWGPHRLDARHRLNISGILDIPLGFQLSSIIRYKSAYPYNIILGIDANQDGQSYDYPAGMQRNAGRTSRFFQIDARLSKFVRIGRFGFQLFGEFYNLLNTVNYPSWAYIGNMQSALFGTPVGADIPRLIQFGARIDF